MKKFILFLLTLLIVISYPTFAFARKQPEKNKTVTLPIGQTVNKDYFGAGQTVILSGTVNGDAYVAGGTVIVDGTITGDLLAAGGTINIRGTVGNNIRVAGGNVNISGKVGKNVTAVGGNITVNDTAQLNGNFVSGAGNITVLGPVTKDITIGAGNATLNSVVDGNVEAAVKHLVIASSGKVNGNVTYWSDNQAEIQPGALVTGKTSQQALPKEMRNEENKRELQQEKEQAVKGFVGFFLIMGIIGMFSSLIVGLVLIKLIPVYVKNVMEKTADEPWKMLGIGFLTVIALPVLGVILFVTILGIPFAIAAFMLLMVLCYFSHLVTALVTGNYVLGKLNRKTSLGWTLAVGLLLTFVISLIPFAGKLVLFIIGLMSVGAIVTNHHNLFNQIKAKKMV